jgi:hypothetical protein
MGTLALVACGDNGNNNKPVDAPVTPDAGPPPVGLTSDEGGGIIYEYINVSDQLAGALGIGTARTVTRVMAAFMNNMNPQKEPTPLLDMCFDLYATHGWPLGQGTDRQYVDVGTLTITAPDATTKDIPKATAANVMTFPKDDIGRQHDVFYQLKDVPAYQTGGTYYDTVFGGSAMLPATTFPKTLYMPDDYTSTMQPGLNDAITLKAGTDFVSTWTPQPNTNAPNEGELVNLTFLIDPMTGSPVIMCVALTTPGTATMTGASIASYRSSVTANGGNPDIAILSRQQDSHLVRQLPNGDPNNVRRIDFLAAWCNIQLVNVTP